MGKEVIVREFPVCFFDAFLITSGREVSLKFWKIFSGNHLSVGSFLIEISGMDQAFRSQRNV